ncbi:DUF1841 family protein [Pseudoduganella namucuonensis]|uniref:DUF1841 family protein n=1 Tax=Pseudoduganella namucuonensis TaxID=1035707 RepID=A0A1I7LIL7_9BURK|nr:DUF1841 family protein [Pseudoduganella namucuonensis]SFV09478.1 protein of unknown function [Pseudoduganella namucuonensis]
MFNPSSDDVRRFFCGVFRKQRAREVLTPLETMAGDWIRHHPEYEDVLADEEAALAREFPVDGGQTNPFLHLSMHLSIDEQISIDQPPGIREAATALTLRLDSAHEAQHQIMECLGEMIWNAQRNGLPLDGDAYVEAVKRRIR